MTAYRIVEILVGLPILLNTVCCRWTGGPRAATAPAACWQRMVEVGTAIGRRHRRGRAVASVPIVLVLGGSQYRDAARPLAILSFALIFVFLNQAFNVSLIARRRRRRIAVAGLIGLAVVVAGGLILIPPLEAEGAAIAALIGEIALCVATYTGLRGTLEGHLDARFAVRLLAAIAPAAACLAPVGPALARAVLAAVVFAAAVWRAGVDPGRGDRPGGRARAATAPGRRVGIPAHGRARHRRRLLRQCPRRHHRRPAATAGPRARRGLRGGQRRRARCGPREPSASWASRSSPRRRPAPPRCSTGRDPRRSRTRSTTSRARFDTILCLDVLEHLVDPESVLRRLTELAAPGARLRGVRPERPPLLARPRPARARDVRVQGLGPS